MKKTIFLIFILLSQYIFSQKAQYPFQDKSLSAEKRAEDLLSRMSLHEKILQMQHLHDITGTENLNGISYGCASNTNLSADSANLVYKNLQEYFKEKTRWGIPVLTCTEAIHGAYQSNCTIYPQSLAQGSTFNPELVKRMVEYIIKDLKSMNIKQILSPDLDLARELRWGRVEETYGEDPFLGSRMGIAFVKTAEENGIITTPKHIIAHGTPLGGLNLASVSGGERELRSLYLIPFERVIKEARPLSIMNCYSSYDRIPIAGSSYYLTKILRDELKFNGYVYSDWGSVEMLKYFHGTAKDDADAAKQALCAGIDLEAAGKCYLNLENLVNENTLDIKYINRAVKRILYVKFASGLFDNPVNNIEPGNVIHSKESVSLAKEIADESIILLQNNNSILPLSLDKYKSIAVIGPNADKFQPGDYSWTRNLNEAVTPLEGIKDLAGNKIKINYAKGCDHWSQNKDGFNTAIEAVKNSDIAIVIVGTESATFTDMANSTCGEGFDLSDLKLPGVQQELLETIKQTGKPLIVVLVSGKPLAIPWIKMNADAVLVEWYGGEQQGAALADVLFGKVNPSGKLNVSFPRSTGHLPCYYNYLPSDKGYYKKHGSLEKPGRDYVFSSPEALWSFGYGLSYTTFEYQNAELSAEQLTDKDTLLINITIKNTGNISGKEVVQLYVRDIISSVETPVKQLQGFEKIFLNAGETKTVTIKLPISNLFLYNEQMQRVVEPGDFEIQIGAASDDIKIKKIITVK